jgi:hypothetical protein
MGFVPECILSMLHEWGMRIFGIYLLPGCQGMRADKYEGEGLVLHA